MHITLRRAVGTAACALAMTLAAPTAAQAETQTAKDPRGDVETYGTGKAASKRVVDVARSTNRYQGDVLRLSLQLVSLRATNYQMSWLVRAGGVLHVGYYSTIGGASVFGFDAVGPIRQRGVPCEGLDVSVNRDSDRVTMRVPATCFGATESVRVAASAERRLGDGNTARVDDARREGYDNERGLKFGPVLERS